MFSPHSHLHHEPAILDQECLPVEKVIMPVDQPLIKDHEPDQSTHMDVSAVARVLGRLQQEHNLKSLAEIGSLPPKNRKEQRKYQRKLEKPTRKREQLKEARKSRKKTLTPKPKSL